MAVDHRATPTDQPSSTTRAGSPPRSAQAEGLARAVGEGGLRSQTGAALQLYANGVGYRGALDNPAFLASVDPQLAQNILTQRWEATKQFFASWSESIRENAQANFQASMRKNRDVQLQTTQERNRQQREEQT